jgi:hypothetical protein
MQRRHRGLEIVFARGVAAGTMVVGFVAAACAKGRPPTGTEILERGEMRDAWLAVLLPVATAALLVLVLIIRRQRRHDSTRLDLLFRSYRWSEVRLWWHRRMVAREHWLSDRRARDLQNDAAAELIVAQSVQLARIEDEQAARRARRIIGMDGTTVILRVDQRALVTTSDGARDGIVYDISDDALTVADWRTGKNRQVSWKDIREIRVREGRERQWGIPLMVAVIGSGLLGYCGWFFDELGHSTAGHYPESSLMIWMGAIGAAIGATFGMIIMYALPGPHWRKLGDATDDAPLTPATFATRAAATAAVGPTHEQDLGGEVIARTLLAIFVLVLLSFCAR